MKSIIILFTLMCVLAKIDNCQGYNFLGVFPTMAKSHYIVGSALMKGLANAGHNVTVLTPFASASSIPNYKEIDVPEILNMMKGKMNSLLDLNDQSITEMFTDFYNMGINLTNITLNVPAVRDFMKADHKFDAVIVEVFINEALLGFGQYFKAPVIGVSTFGASKWTNDLVGSPSPISYVPHVMLSSTDKMSFSERLANTMMNLCDNIYFNLFYIHKQKAIYDKSFPDPKPDFDKMRKNVALVLLNSHFTLNIPRPYVPNMIEVGGMHIKRIADPLPNDLQTFLDNAKEGVVYFSMGSNIQSKTLPVDKRDALLKTFGKLKQKVLWKWEDDFLSGKPDNVLIRKWFPQDAILAHKNVKVFITHGGLLSTTEAIYYGVPVIGIPIFGDQNLNMARSMKAGFGLMVKYKNLTETSLTWALTEMLNNNNKYAEKAKIFSFRYRDQPLEPLQTAIYWAEYVARHQGAPHIHSAGQDLCWFEYHNLDVFALIALVLFVILKLIIMLIKKIFRKSSQTTAVHINKKNN